VVDVMVWEGELVITGEKAGWPQGWSGQVWKISPPPGFDPWTVQPIAIHYTGYTIPAQGFTYIYIHTHTHIYIAGVERLWWCRGGVLAFGTQVCEFKPGRSRWIFRAKKSSARLPSKGK